MKSLRNKMSTHQACHSVVYNDNKNDKIYWDLISQVGFRFWLRTREDIWWRVNDQIRDQVFNNIKSL